MRDETNPNPENEKEETLKFRNVELTTPIEIEEDPVGKNE
jgi:hypothetical protein